MIDTVLTLADVREEALHLLHALKTAWPDRCNAQTTEEAEIAMAELEDLLFYFDEDYQAFLDNEKLTGTPETEIDFITGVIFEKRQRRLLQTIDLYKILNACVGYAAEQSDSLAKKFRAMATKEDVLGLRQFIINELDEINENINNDPESPDRKAKKHLIAKCKKELNDALGVLSSTDAQQIDFALEPMLIHTIAMILEDLEFNTAVALKYNAEHFYTFVTYREFLSNLLHHVGALTDSFMPDSEWERPEMSSLSTTTNHCLH
jgi:hypothetical protein